MKSNRLANRISGGAEHIDSEGSWAISYGDMITLLLSFFVLYFTVDHDATKQMQLTDSLMGELEQLNKSAPSDINKSNEAFSKLKIMDSLEQFNKKFPSDIKKLSQMVAIPGVDNAISLHATFDKNVLEKFKSMEAKFHKIGNSIVVEFKNLSFFDSGKTVIKEKAKKVLGDFVSFYTPYAGHYILSIRAYTDKDPVKYNKDRFKDNLELSALRSIAAMRYMRAAGVPLNRMQIGGFGVTKKIGNVIHEIEINMSQEDLKSLDRKIILVIKPDPYKEKV